MAITTIGTNSPQAVKRWGLALADDIGKQSYFTRFTGEGSNNIIEKKVDLETVQGDSIKFDLMMRMRGAPTYGDNIIVGNEEELKYFQDEVKIDQVRKAGSAGGAMSQKRTIRDLRQNARQLTGEYLSEWLDEGFFVYLSGDSTFGAINQDAKFATTFAGNAVTAPDADHIMYGGAATSKASLTATDKMTAQLIERAAVKTDMLNSVNPDVVRMSPVTAEGEKVFVMLMSPFQQYDLRTEVGDLSWSKIAQAAMASEGRMSPVFKGGLGKIANVVLHSHASVRRFNNYGAGQNVAAGRALLLGRQAGVVAYGKAGNGTRMKWVEESADAGNLINIYCGMITGFKKTVFNNKDFGVIAIDTACKDPN